jgi:hypothetical protein
VRAVTRRGRCVVNRPAIIRPSGHAAIPERKIVPMAWAVQVSRHCLYALRSLLTDSSEFYTRVRDKRDMKNTIRYCILVCASSN